MPRNITVTLEDGKTHVYQNTPDNITPDQVIARAQEEFGVGVANVDGGSATVEQQPNTVGRQLGLTARHLIEGGSELVGIASDPIAMLMRKGGMGVSNAGEAGANLSDSLGLPKPQNPTERIVGTGSKMLVGTGGMMKTAATAGTNAMTKALTSKPFLQATSALGAGVSGAVTKEMGGGPEAQFAASIAGGLGFPLGAEGAKSLIKTIKNISVKPSDTQINNAIKQAGIDLDSMPSQASESMKRDIKATLSASKDVSPDALRRLADYKVIGATPTKGSLTLKPADVTRDRNLAKLGANSSDPAAQELANVANKNNQTLIGELNTLGAETADDAISAGGKIISSLNASNTKAKATIGSLYDKARATDGRSAKIDPRAFTQKANDLLDESLLSGRLPADVRNKLNSIAKGDTPLTVDVAEQFKSNIGRLQRATADPAERLALSKVREALDDAPLIDGQGEAAISAFNKARKANAAYMQKVESTPALKAVRDGIEPDKFVQQFIVGNGSKSNIADIKALKGVIKGDEQAMQTIKEQVVAHLKNKAVNNADDEVANFSASNYSKALKTIGDMKLDLFFSKKEIDLLKTVGRVASYDKFQPVGSAVNNSNTASSVAGLLDWIASNSVIRKIPYGSELISNPASNISTGASARNALNPSKGIAAEAVAKKKLTIPLSPLLAPSLAVE